MQVGLRHNLQKTSYIVTAKFKTVSQRFVHRYYVVHNFVSLSDKLFSLQIQHHSAASFISFVYSSSFWVDELLYYLKMSFSCILLIYHIDSPKNGHANKYVFKLIKR